MTDENASARNAAAENNPAADKVQRNPDMVTLVSGVIALSIAAGVLSGQPWDLVWFLAAGAVVAGAALLATSLRSRRRHG